MKKHESQLLGQLLGLLILLGILLIKVIVIYLDKKWHEKGHGHWIEGIRDLPPLYPSQFSRHSELIQWDQRMLRSLQNPVSTNADRIYHCTPQLGFQNSNWILKKRLDVQQSQK